MPERYHFDVDFGRGYFSYRMRAAVSRDRMKEFIKAFGQTLVFDSGSYGNRDRMPFFNLDQLVDYDSASGLPYGLHAGTIDMRPFFSALAKFLIGYKYIDETNVRAPYEINMDKIWNNITERRSNLVELKIGGMTVQAEIANFANHVPTADEEFKDAVRAELETVKADSDAALESARALIAENAGYTVPVSDIYLGWISCAGHLAHRVSHAPSIVVSNGISYRVKPAIVKKFKHDILIRYKIKTGEVYVTNVDGTVTDPRPTNHTHLDGAQCTGTIKTTPNLPYDKAKKLVLEIVNSLNVINRDSTLGDNYGTYFLNADFLKNQCTPVEGTIKDGDVL